MKNDAGLPEHGPVLNMLIRLLKHAKTFEEIGYLWKLHLNILKEEERHIWLIHVFTKYQFSLPKEFPDRW